MVASFLVDKVAFESWRASVLRGPQRNYDLLPFFISFGQPG
jgi:hypothetical protein